MQCVRYPHFLLVVNPASWRKVYSHVQLNPGKFDGTKRTCCRPKSMNTPNASGWLTGGHCVERCKKSLYSVAESARSAFRAVQKLEVFDHVYVRIDRIQHHRQMPA